MKNKDVVEKFIAYFREHADFDAVARALACMLIDANRLVTLESLPEKERNLFWLRVHANAKIVRDFAKDGCSDPFSVINLGEE